MNESVRVLVSGLFTVYPSVSLRPLMTSKPVGEDVGEDDGDVLGEMATLIFVVRERRIGIFAFCRCWYWCRSR